MNSLVSRNKPVLWVSLAAMLAPVRADRPVEGAPYHESALIFPLEGWHNHASCVVELPDGSLLACWFHGSGERTADDVRIEGARWRAGQERWSPRFVLADTPGYPDTNPALFVDGQQRLWLIWPVILANRWETALLKYRVSRDWDGDGPPRWEKEDVLHVTPGPEFASAMSNHLERVEAGLPRWFSGSELGQWRDAVAGLRSRAADKLWQRLGWMTRAHPQVLEGGRILVPLYSDGWELSLMAYSDDAGQTWRSSTPLAGIANVQPSVVRRRDGSLYTLMRDNGPPPMRLAQSVSHDRGATWSDVTDSPWPNPGSGAEVIALRNGHWALVGNDTEEGRHRLAVWISDDEGRSWRWRRHLESDAPGPNSGRYHYPSIVQTRDGWLHVTYSCHLNRPDLPRGTDGRPLAKAIQHARFNEAWVQAGEAASPAP
ncbi:MAG TPA: sialidase family protein [Candidatus Paceibacterota bacterium]|nr:exo-alpha-sialidase [Verrucomicrobiota bacterium]HOX01477.1 sialidase family protein [Verrucomicrobiota bacterium]HRZ44215.1 sialidase family protein [Candidatus Paceibacterota bacterium]HRZ92452.1 sialidase family protein [Candidatus Paceibacterota bacterium]